MNMQETEEMVREKAWNLCKEYDAQGRRRSKVRLTNFVTIALERMFSAEIENDFRGEWQNEVEMFCKKYHYAE
ncbi:MAG: hypothetical protein MOGMAGMI_02500 [Candidatus Omnitrophica bacterium]|nr:hypothetical protein [Candidatus Omnitrophota bacterium]